MLYIVVQKLIPEYHFIFGVDHVLFEAVLLVLGQEVLEHEPDLLVLTGSCVYQVLGHILKGFQCRLDGFEVVLECADFVEQFRIYLLS